MTKLIKEIIIAKAKQSDLTSITRFNCCASNLTDITLIEKMPNVEILSLSVNKIKNLRPLGQCKKLRELYLRKNDICDLNEIEHLRKLPDLEQLWLADNPLYHILGANYRSVILRALPNLKILDDAAVTSEELNDALRVCGDCLVLDSPTREKQTSVNTQHLEDQEWEAERTLPEFNQFPEDTQPHSLGRSISRNILNDCSETRYNLTNRPKRSTFLNGSTQNLLANSSMSYVDRNLNNYSSELKNTTTTNTNATTSTGTTKPPAPCCSNLLSATLCLVKELDIVSLQVVQHIICSRIEEFSAK